MEQRKIQRIVFMPPDKIGTDRREFLLQTLKQNRFYFRLLNKIEINCIHKKMVT